MAKVSPNNIQTMQQPWSRDPENGLPFSGDAVEQFIKKTFGEKVGYTKVVTGRDGVLNILAGFANEDDYDSWMELTDAQKWGEEGAVFLVTTAVIPLTENADTYAVGLTLQETPAPVQRDTDITIAIKGTSSVTYAAGGSESIQEDLIVTIQTRINSTSAWITRGTINITANSANWTEISLAPFLTSGINYVRIQASGEYSFSLWRSFSFNVVALSLTPNSSFEVPFRGSALVLNYLIGGNVAKLLQFEFGTGIGADFQADYSFENLDPGCVRDIGTATNLTTGINYDFADPTMLEDLMTDGVHTVRARLYVSESVKTDWVESQYFVANGQVVAPAVVVNKAHLFLDNWSDVTFFHWAANKEMDVRFRLVDSSDSTKVYGTWTRHAEYGVEYDLSSQLAIELDDPTDTAFYAYMHIEDLSGNDLADPAFFSFTNSMEISPVVGADLIILPFDRSNTETTPKSIINKVNGNAVTSTWEGFGMVSDGWIDVNKDVESTAANAEKIRALHIPADRRLTINYNPFVDFMDGMSTGRHMTLEIDFRTNNILDDDEPIIKICDTYSVDGKAWGFEMLPKEAYLMTQRKRSQDDQNVTWCEGIRTHLALNIVYGLNGLNYVRIFINGRIEREFNYAVNDVFVGGNVSIVLGNTTSDLDIFGLRVYKKALSTEEVMQDYKASLSTLTEKMAFASSNDILGDNGSISFQKAREKYNVIGLTGHLAKYGDENKGKTNGNSLYIGKPFDLAHSGTLTNLENAGQGTTAMTYYDWNQQQKISDDTMFIPDSNPDNPVSASGGFAPAEGEAMAKKLCGKINFASSMQGHKMGLTKIYDEVFKRMVASGVLTEPSQIALQPSARLAVFEEPYLFFHRETEADPWVFKYLMTWGSAKGDKPTFGFNKNTTPDFLMLEGANNDRPLALFKIPWNADINYSVGDEAWMYNGQKQLNFGFGKTDSNEVPNSTNALNAMKNFFNFCYLHNLGLLCFNGTLTQLRASNAVDTTKFYWTTTADSILGSDVYDVFRYDEITHTWVNAGITKMDVGQYEVLNLRSQYEDMGGTDVWTAGQWDTINQKAIAQRIAHFRANASNYMHVDDSLYHSCFIKFFAGTDNRAKNTYYYTDPVTLKIRHMQDDLDTTIKTNNVGQNRKPYYVEEHDTNAAGEFYWQGEDSGYYNLLETAFESEMSVMMNNFFTAMASLSSSVLSYLESRLLAAQDYFPAIAYNEQARLVYETAAVAQESGIYVNSSVPAITQSCGTQRWSEYDWLKLRVMYISSWCEYGEFAGSSSAANGLSWRGKASAVYNFRLKTAKWLYPRVGSDSGNYPASVSGRRVRVAAGETIEYPTITLSSDSWISIRGINYFLEIGDMNINVSAEQGMFTFYGKLLQKIEVNPEGADTNLMLATSISIANATNIKSLVVRGVSTVRSEIDLTACRRLASIDLRGSSFPIVELPSSDSLTTVKFPATLTGLRLEGTPNLTLVTFEGLTYLSSVYIDQATVGNVNSAILASDIYTAKGMQGSLPLMNARFLNIEWTDFRADVLMYYANSGVCNITGTIAMRTVVNDRYLTFYEVTKLFDVFGNIQSVSNPLYVDYPKSTITSFMLKGEKFISQTGLYEGWSLDITPATGNNVAFANGKEAVAWEFVGSNSSFVESYAVLTDAVRGKINVIQTSAPELELNFTLRITITLIDNTTVVFNKTVGFYRRIPRLGDFAYADGSFDYDYDTTKTLVGHVTRVTKVDNSTYDCEVMAKEDQPVVSNINRYTGSPLNEYTLQWGPSAASNGLGSTIKEEVTAACGFSFDDTPVPNRSTRGVYNADKSSTNATAITDGFLDDDSPDGYSYPNVNGVGQDFDGKGNTAIIIDCAKNVITNYLRAKYPNNEYIKIPSNIRELGDMMAALEQEANNEGASAPNRYWQFVYPATYKCYLYEPIVGVRETLHQQYRKTNWYNPAAGQMYRVYNFLLNSLGKDGSNRVKYSSGGRLSEEYANENPTKEAYTPLFANALLRIHRVTSGTPFSLPVYTENQYYWTSDEKGTWDSYCIRFRDGDIDCWDPKSASWIGSWPFCTFRYTL